MNVLRNAAFAALLVAAGLAHAAAPASVREWRQANEAQILAELTALLRLPNVASDSEGIARNADALTKMMQRRGLAPRLLVPSAHPDAPPAVYGEWNVPGATGTLLFYAHYDGQPVDPSQWATDPWTPTWRDGALGGSGTDTLQPDAKGPFDPAWRIYGRSASDDKAGVVAILAAADALKAMGVQPTVNLKFFFEGEEEAGSPHLRALASERKELLRADAWIVCDGPVHATGRKQVVYGVRGDANVDVVVYGPKRPLHSGHYGNWAPNPALGLARLLASMKDADGRVSISGWYDDVVALGPEELRALAAAPQADDRLRDELGLAATELPGKSLAEAINLPSLNINGIRSADVGEQASNVIPVIASATLDLRFVKGVVPARQIERLVAHIREQGFFVVDREPTDAERLAHARIAKVTSVPGGYAASRTPMDHPIARRVARAVQSAAADPVVHIPTMGGSLPLVIVNEVLDTPTITVPIANHDNNQHAENENLRLGNLWEGIEILAAVMRLEKE